MAKRLKKNIVAMIALLMSAVCIWQVSSIAFADEEVRYTNGGISLYSSAEYVYYKTRTQLDYNITPGMAPTYIATGEYTNACGAIAGANTIGFFDKYVEDLIPGWQSYFPANGRYKPDDKVYIPAVIAELYTLMRTNVDDVGVSETDFLNGLQEFVELRDKNITYTSLYSNGVVNYAGCKASIDAGKPILVFMDPTDMVSISLKDGSDYVVRQSLASAHIALIYGYERIQYVLTDNTVRTDTYLIMSTGLTSPKVSYLDITTSVDINDAKGVNIY